MNVLLFFALIFMACSAWLLMWMLLTPPLLKWIGRKLGVPEDEL